MNTIAEIAYLAGIIDGEGSIYIGNFSCNPKTGAKYYQTLMEVTNTDENLIKWLVDKFGGRTNTYTAKQTPTNSRRTVYRWLTSGDHLTQLCHELMPYLVIKKRQCEIMIKMRDTFNKSNHVKKKQGVQPLPDSILNLRQQYFDEMQSLHCRNYKNK